MLDNGARALRGAWALVDSCLAQNFAQCLGRAGPCGGFRRYARAQVNRIGILNVFALLNRCLRYS